MRITFNNPALRLVAPRYDTVELVEVFTVSHALGVISVEKGFVCDLESVPQCLQWLFPKLGRGALAGIAHDELYRRGEVPRVVADAIYLALLRELGVGWCERVTKYLALRAFGFVAWNQHRQNESRPPA